MPNDNLKADHVRATWLLSLSDVIMSGLRDVIKEPLSEDCPSSKSSPKCMDEYEANRRRYKTALRLIRESASNLEKAAVLMGAVSLDVTMEAE